MSFVKPTPGEAVREMLALVVDQYASEMEHPGHYDRRKSAVDIAARIRAVPAPLIDGIIAQAK